MSASVRDTRRVNPARERLRSALHRAQGGRCGICGKRLKNMLAVTLDHVVPWTAGGRNEDNLVAAHMTCNNLKGNRMPTGCERVWLQAALAGLNAPTPTEAR